LLRNAQKRDKKIEQNNRGRKQKQNGGGEKNIFCEPRTNFVEKVFIVLLNSPCYETPKNAIKKIEAKKSGLDFLVNFLVKAFRHHFFVKSFCCVFELTSLKTDVQKVTWKFLSVICKKFSTWSFRKSIFMLFLNSSYRETPKQLLKQSQKKKFSR
jgi:hypothetical protein